MKGKTSAYIFLALFLIGGILYAQNFTISKMEPPNWWAGMKWHTLDLMIYGDNLQDVTVKSDDDEAMRVLKTNQTENGKYLFITLQISSDVSPGKYKLIFEKNNLSVEKFFPILQRTEKPKEHIGFNPHDVVYLITPDRFSDGDTSNDRSPEGLPDQFDRSKELSRHGGDIAGIIRHLDYLQSLGITAIWINPLVTNNTEFSYHGYAATDFYHIDPRFGSNEDYRRLVWQAHKKGIKVILDHVSNHIGINHPWMKNLPYPDWIHGTESHHLKAMHEKVSYFDVHGAEEVSKHLEKGWFVDRMPDLNQDNPHVANYIIQNTIWWMEFAGADGIREDTYSYVSPFFISNWAANILNEYPAANIVGEVWSGEPAYLAAYQQKSKVRDFNTFLPSVTDFALRDAFADFLSGKGNLSQFYTVFSKDYLYSNPNNLLTFIDNHDLVRPILLAEGNTAKVKLAYALLLTSRGIPEILYGDEIGLEGGKSDGEIREDFPGGWASDKRNAFQRFNLTPKEKDLFDTIHKLIELRKRYPALSSGEMTHFPVRNNVYYYIKSIGAKKYLVVLNGNDRSVVPNFDLLKDRMIEYAVLEDLFTMKKYKSNKIKLPPYGFKIFEIK